MIPPGLVTKHIWYEIWSEGKEWYFIDKYLENVNDSEYSVVDILSFEFNLEVMWIDYFKILFHHYSAIMHLDKTSDAKISDITKRFD